MKSRGTLFLLAAVLLIGAAAHAGASLVNMQRFRLYLASRNAEIAFAPGDLTLRDLPKAQQLISAKTPAEFFDDGQYAGEKNWYPFMTPALTALVAKVTDQSAAVSLVLVSIAINTAVIVVVGALLAFMFGWKGVLALGAGAALSFISFNGVAYPIGTVRLPFALFLLVGGALFGGPRRVAPKWRAVLFAMLGVLHGLMGVWQGSSFFTASFVGGVLILYWLVASRGERRSAFTGIALYAVFTVAVFALLVAPQWAQYGRLVTSDEARLYLGNTYDKGDNLAPILTLRFLVTDTGMSLLALIGFASIFVRSPSRWAKPVAVCVALAYGFATCMSALGYAQNSSQAPWLGQFARAFLPAPAHTFGYVAQFCNALMRVMGVGAALAWVMAWAATFFAARLPRLARGAAPIALAALAMIPIALDYTRQERLLPKEGVSKEITEFAARAAVLAPRNATVYGAERVMQYAPFKILIGSAPHANPYAHPTRQRANDLLTDQDVMGAGDAAPFDNTLREFGVKYAIVSSTDKTLFLRLCAGKKLLASSSGAYQLYQLNDSCAYPAFAGSIPVGEAAPNQNAALDASGGALRVGIANPANGYAIATLPLVTIQPRELVGLRVRGQADTAVCLTAGAVFYAAGQDKQLERASKTETVQGSFEAVVWMVAPAGAERAAPTLALDPACAPANQMLRVDSIAIARKALP